MKYYQIIRFYSDDNKPSKLVSVVGSLREAQKWCKREDTKGEGWFDGYDEISPAFILAILQEECCKMSER